MTVLWSTMESYAKSHPDEIALIGMTKCYRWAELIAEVKLVSQELTRFKNQVLALYDDNSPSWVIIDLACRLSDVILLPLPIFFSNQQLTHAIQQAGAVALLHNNDDRFDSVLSASLKEAKEGTIIAGLTLTTLNQKPIPLPEKTAKITFTSGSTGQPKGVCLSNQQQDNVAIALLNRIEIEAAIHLGILPFSTLLENIGGIYAPLLSGGIVTALPQAVLGFNGSNGFELDKLLATILQQNPSSIIVLPELLMALVAAVHQGWSPPESLQFIAVGGSKVSPSLLQQAQSLGLPVYEGYGLSESGSVVSLNSAKQNKLGSIGKPLEHVDVIIKEGEIVVSGNTFLGYINEPDNWFQSELHTGDLGEIDDEGYLYIKGRKKNLLISSFGRNINPEWVESELLANGLLQQVVIFGDARPYCVALLKPRDDVADDVVQNWIDDVNLSLPNYAQVKAWFRLTNLMAQQDGLITSNGRPVRQHIYTKYLSTIEQLYKR